MILQNILKYRNDSNFAQTLLSTIKSSGANPPEKKFFLIMLVPTVISGSFFILLLAATIMSVYYCKINKNGLTQLNNKKNVQKGSKLNKSTL